MISTIEMGLLAPYRSAKSSRSSIRAIVYRDVSSSISARLSLASQLLLRTTRVLSGSRILKTCS